MSFLLDHPLVLLPVVLPCLWIAARLGACFQTLRPTQDLSDDDFNLVLGATLTLLGLIIGFSFSMAVSRYDQRKNYEEQEANAIGTEYVRADLLPSDAAKLRSLLRDYLDQRIVYYTTRDPGLLRQSAVTTSELQSRLWSAVAAPTATRPDPVTALVASGMNDVLNSQGYTEAAWRNRVPTAAWVLLFAIAVFSNLMLGCRAHGKSSLLFLVLPIALAVSFALIADIDSPRGGLIRIHPQNLESLADSLRPQ
jgi:hypothetical protein